MYKRVIGYFILLLHCNFATVFCESSFRNASHYTIEESDEKLEIDGKMTEKIWEKVEDAGHFVTLSSFQPSRYTTQFRLCFDKKYLYLLVSLQNFDFRPNLENQDEKKNLSYLEFYLLTNEKSKKTYKFQINTVGKIQKRIIDNIRNVEFENPCKIEYGYVLREDHTVSLEIRIALKDIGFQEEYVLPFLFNMTRHQIEYLENEPDKAVKEKKK